LAISAAAAAAWLEKTENHEKKKKTWLQTDAV
jgi:hypothetical protein